MFAKRLLQKATHHHHHLQSDPIQGTLKPTDLDAQIFMHFGIPSTASVLAVDPIQQLLAIGTLDGRIKVVGGNSIEGLLISPKKLPYKNLEFLQNEGYLVGILNDNDIQVWNLGRRCITCSLQWQSNITAFSVISGSLFMLVGDQHGMVSVLRYAAEDGKLVRMPYHISPDCLVGNEKDPISFPVDQPVIGVLPHPCSFGNRLLIAFQYGLIFLWDVLEAKVVVIKGDKDLHIKENLPTSKLDVDPCDLALENVNGKEISALCWASSFGSMVAVGYIDGDILLWNISGDTLSKGKSTGVSGKDVVKLQLSSAGKRLPVIVLHWSSVSQNNCEGQLFVYGGCEIGSEEVITVVNLQWSPDMEMLKNVRRVDLALVGSFADMVLLSSLGTAGKRFDGLFVLTNPGKLQFHALETLCALFYHQERKSSVSGIEPPVVIPTSDPQITDAKLSLLPCDATFSMWLSEIASVGSTLGSAEIRTWPLHGGTNGEISIAEAKLQKSIYIAGYRDGSVRIWDATSPILSLLSVLEGQVHGMENVCPDTSVAKLDFCPYTMSLAVGTQCGAVRVYNLHKDAEGTKLHLIKHSEHEVHDVLPSKGPQCRAVVSLVDSPVRSLQFSSCGSKLVVAFESSHVAVLDIISLSVLFVTDSIPSSKQPVISVILRKFSEAEGLKKGSKHSGANNAEKPKEELLFTLTQDAKVNIVDSRTGTPISSRPLHLKKKLTAISMYVLGGSHLMPASLSEDHEQSSKDTAILQELTQDGTSKKTDEKGAEHLSMEGGNLLDSLLLLCGETKLRLYDMKSVIQGEDKPAYKVKLGNTCFWTSLLSKDDKVYGLIVCYNTGDLEVRSFPDLELVGQSSLMSILRWTFRPKMEKLMCSTENGLISLVNGNELAFISLSFGENETRLLKFLPLLHDKVVAAAAHAAIHHSEKQKKQVPVSGVLGGIVKGFKKEKSKNAKDASFDCNFAHLGDIFSRPITSGFSGAAENTEEEEQLDIDDIEIDDEPVTVASSSSHQGKGKQTGTDRAKLFQGHSVDTKPRMRTREEILAAYKGPEYAAAAAENARNKLLERQEKLERISKRTEDLRGEAEDFASMANELVKTMENRKWWKI